MLRRRMGKALVGAVRSPFFLKKENSETDKTRRRPIMTVLQALRMAVGYPLDETALERIVIDRKLTPEAPYTGQTPEFMLARADVYMALAVSPDVAMDGFSLTVADRSLLTTLAESLYRQYDPAGEHPGIFRDAVRDSSDIW